MTRRRFLGLAASYATLTAFLSLSEVVPANALVRPPGAVREEEFLRSCLRCGACVDVCPVHGLAYADLMDGLRNVGTPKLVSFCMVYRGLEEPSSVTGHAWKANSQAHGQEETCFECIKACPTGALAPVEANHLRMGLAAVDKELCRAWLYGTCGFPCVNACPFDAISITVGPVVDEEKCVGCNQCAIVCPTRESGPPAISVRPNQGGGG